jgi:predicted lipoprotein
MARAGWLLALAVLLQPAPGLAQSRAPGTPSEAEMRQLMEAMQGMQACMAGVDQAALKRMQQRAEQAEAEMRQLCRAGQESAAKARALALGQQIGADPAIQTMQACMAKLPKLPMLQSASPLGQLRLDDEPVEGNPRPICERLK